jgi:hypothetical protein
MLYSIDSLIFGKDKVIGSLHQCGRFKAADEKSICIEFKDQDNFG